MKVLHIMTSKKYKTLFGALTLVVILYPASSAKVSPVTELHQTGLYGRVHAWNNKIRKSHRVKVVVPQNAPIIISDYHSKIGANGLRRGGKHRGVDIFAATGTPIIAAANGRVIRAKVDRCWGPTILVSHGLDKNNRPFYALYGHVRNIMVKVGQKVNRGQQIAEMGEDIFTSCGAGLHHLHFQISYNPRKIPILGWGWANFVMDGARAPNPHKYWENGKGKITCFDPNRKYSSFGLTYPVPCTNLPSQQRRSTARLAQQNLEQTNLQKALLSSLEKALAIEKNTMKEPPISIQSDQESVDYNTLKNKLLSSMEELWEEDLQ